MEQGGIIFVNILLVNMFIMSNSIISGLHKYLENFGRGGLSKTRGDNLTNITAQRVADIERLCESKALPHETPSKKLTGLTKCSVPEFKGPFELVLNSERLV